MAVITDQPKNINFLSPLGFRFKLARAPNLNFFVTDINLPTISLGSITIPTPFKFIDIANNKLDYGDLQLTFMLDENLDSYFEIYNWLVAIGFPDNFDQYKRIKDAPKGSKDTTVSDATLTILTSDMVPNIEVQFEDLFPTSISEINFAVSDTDVNYVRMNVSFKYRIYRVKKVV
jgi:hypothetical protein